MRVLPEQGHEVIGLDILDSPFTDRRRLDRRPRRRAAARRRRGRRGPQRDAAQAARRIARSRRQFVDTNITGHAATCSRRRSRRGVEPVHLHSTTSTFGRALEPAAGRAGGLDHRGRRPGPAQHLRHDQERGRGPVRADSRATTGCRAWCCRPRGSFPSPTTATTSAPRTRTSTSRSTSCSTAASTSRTSSSAHLLALERAPAIGFGRYIISATTPFTPDDLSAIRADLPAVVRRLYPDYEDVYRDRGWRMFRSIERVYVNERARRELGWAPRYGFRTRSTRLAGGSDPRSELARSIGTKGYHAVSTGVYTVR